VRPRLSRRAAVTEFGGARTHQAQRDVELLSSTVNGQCTPFEEGVWGLISSLKSGFRYLEI